MADLNVCGCDAQRPHRDDCGLGKAEALAGEAWENQEAGQTAALLAVVTALAEAGVIRDHDEADNAWEVVLGLLDGLWEIGLIEGAQAPEGGAG